MQSLVQIDLFAIEILFHHFHTVSPLVLSAINIADKTKKNKI